MRAPTQNEVATMGPTPLGRAMAQYGCLLLLSALPLALLWNNTYWINILAYTYLFAALAAAWNVIGGLGGQLADRDREIVEINALERLALRRDGLRVIHGDRDQLVNVDVLEIKHLEHMAAAITQKLHGLGLIADGIELSLDVRPGGDLAEGESDGKNLNEDAHPGTAAV